MAELIGRSSQYIYASARLSHYIFLSGKVGVIALIALKGKSLIDNIFTASTTAKKASNNVLRASNG